MCSNWPYFRHMQLPWPACGRGPVAKANAPCAAGNVDNPSQGVPNAMAGWIPGSAGSDSSWAVRIVPYAATRGMSRRNESGARTLPKLRFTGGEGNSLRRRGRVSGHKGPEEPTQRPTHSPEALKNNSATVLERRTSGTVTSGAWWRWGVPRVRSFITFGIDSGTASDVLTC